MPVNAEPLLKILELEQKKGFNDTTVFGGLDKFLHNWSQEASALINNPKLLRRFNALFTKATYASLSSEQRKKWAEDIRVFLQELDRPEEKPAAKPASIAKPKTVKVKPTIVNPSGPLEAPITIIKGISTNLAAKFAKLGVKTVRDLLYFFPHRHMDYSQHNFINQLIEGKEQTIIANVWEARVEMIGGRMRSTKAQLGDETGNIEVVWFNNPYIAKQLTVNNRVIISGKVSVFHGRMMFQNPEWEPAEEGDFVHTGRLVPVYSLTEGLHPRQVRKLIKSAVDEWSPKLEEFLPQDIKKRCNLIKLAAAVANAHYPENLVLKDKARVRLAFDELFLLQLGVLNKKRKWQISQPGNPFKINRPVLDAFTRSLPFSLTAAQKKVTNEILADLSLPTAMSRLLQGDVGSGKTVVATIALLQAVANGFQGALMAPTEILAEQHLATISQLLSRCGQCIENNGLRTYSGLLAKPVIIALLTGAAAAKKKRELQACINNGEIDIIIGTHALIQEDVAFKKLGLAVVDEQHRFGVEQRSALRQKGYNPHILVMTATPIPRTLALTLYGDLDLSVIDSLPPGRQSIKTKWLTPDQRASAYRFIAKEVAAGRQAFIICPLIEESEAVQAKAATAEYEKLSSEIFTDLKLGLLHGKLPNDEKDRVMQSFRSGEYNILVATPVIEVGIDVPNATVMLVESDDRFGLSQLHQFRGRVGRGPAQSYCMLLADDPSEIGRQRLDIIERVQNGFVLAEEDLKLRGPGEFFGTRQSGLPDLHMAMLSDTAILETARLEATGLFAKDPDLKQAEHLPLRKELVRVWPKEKIGEWS